MNRCHNAFIPTFIGTTYNAASSLFLILNMFHLLRPGIYIFNLSAPELHLNSLLKFTEDENQHC